MITCAGEVEERGHSQSRGFSSDEFLAMGEEEREKGELEEALALFKRALRKEPENREIQRKVMLLEVDIAWSLESFETT